MHYYDNPDRNASTKTNVYDGKSKLRVLIKDMQDPLDNPEIIHDIPLFSFFVDHKDMPSLDGAMPDWTLGRPTLHDGKTYLSVWTDAVFSSGKTYRGIDSVFEIDVGYQLKTQAPWPKAYANKRNTNGIRTDRPRRSSQENLGHLQMTIHQDGK